MAQSVITMQSGNKVTVNHQFGTVRRNLNEAAQRIADDKTGKTEAFAEFNTDSGRVSFNPLLVETYAEIKE